MSDPKPIRALFLEQGVLVVKAMLQVSEQLGDVEMLGPSTYLMGVGVGLAVGALDAEGADRLIAYLAYDGDETKVDGVRKMAVDLLATLYEAEAKRA